MPIIKADDKLVLYAHVPKCGGSAVSWYLKERFGLIAFQDGRHTRHEPGTVWSRTSPQHIDRQSLGRLFPNGFFDACFTIVRHPVSRIVSAYHFQLEVEQLVPESTDFSEWLHDIIDMRAENPFLFDNHVRPMVDIVPEGATVFHMEHGLDALVPWFDALTGRKDAPRALPRINDRGAYRSVSTERARPTEADLAIIAREYAEDFARFGYKIGDKAPMTPAPTLTPDLLAERDAALKSYANPIARLKRKVVNRLGR